MNAFLNNLQLMFPEIILELVKLKGIHIIFSTNYFKSA